MGLSLMRLSGRLLAACMPRGAPEALSIARSGMLPKAEGAEAGNIAYGSALLRRAIP